MGLPRTSRARWATLLAALATSACRSDSPGPDILGQPSDVQTSPGRYDGFEVHTCGSSANEIGIRGIGAKALTSIDDVWNAGSEVCQVVSDIPSRMSCGGIGTVCDTLGTTVDINDWREVDLVIARVGGLLRDRDWSLEVALTVRGPARPQ